VAVATAWFFMSQADAGSNPVPTEDCWSARQIEKEEFESARMQLMDCEQKVKHRAGHTGSALRAIRMAERACPFSNHKVTDLLETLSQAPKELHESHMCTWQALSSFTSGTWVDRARADEVFGRRPHARARGRSGRGADACAAKASWSPCAAPAHDREWLPDLVHDGLCKMKRLGLPEVADSAGRPVSILLHGDERVRALYGALVCASAAHLRREKRHRFPAEEGGVEVWAFTVDGGSTVQYVGGDPSYARAPSVAGADTGFGDMRAFDIVVSSAEPAAYQPVAWGRGYHGPVVHVSGLCTACDPALEDDECYVQAGAMGSILAARQLAWPVLDLCALMRPRAALNDSAAHGTGAPLDGALCSPGPADDALHVLLHVLHSQLHGAGQRRPTPEPPFSMSPGTDITVLPGGVVPDTRAKREEQ